MNYKKLYPFTIRSLRERRELIIKAFQKLEPHKEAFIGVAELKGCFAAEKPEALCETLAFGERLLLTACGETAPLEAYRADGSFVGGLSVSESALPKWLMRRGVEVFCYVEAVEMFDDAPAVAVSIYCEDY